MLTTLPEGSGAHQPEKFHERIKNESGVCLDSKERSFNVRLACVDRHVPDLDKDSEFECGIAANGGCYLLTDANWEALSSPNGTVYRAESLLNFSR